MRRVIASGINSIKVGQNKIFGKLKRKSIKIDGQFGNYESFLKKELFTEYIHLLSFVTQ